MDPRVSVLCIAYNQRDFIAQALDSFLSQKTDFDFEILVHDDASTDGTREILEDYQSKYPHQIKLMLQDKNQFKRGVRGMFPKYLFPRASGEYLALCDGDDYWCTSSKLQKQVDYMDSNPGSAICFHSTKWIYPDDGAESKVTPDESSKNTFDIYSLMRDNFIHTSSVMYRRGNNLDMINLDNIYGTDWFLNLYNARFGDIGFIDEVMSVYRKHRQGISYNAYSDVTVLLSKHWGGIAARYLEELKIVSYDEQLKRQAIEKLRAHIVALDDLAIPGFRKWGILQKLKYRYRNEWGQAFI